MSSDTVAADSSAAPKAATPRLLAPDLARGMMLLFIAIANVSVYLWGRDSDGFSSHVGGEGTLDTVLSALVILLIDGHVYPMFAFLFGYGITQFAYSRVSAGVPANAVSSMLLRRNLWLLAFGAVHALLLFGGDILGAYALTGLALSALLLRASGRVLKIVLWVLGSVSVAFIVLPMLLTGALGLLLPFDASALTGMDPSGSSPLAGGPEAWNLTEAMSGNEHYWQALLARLIMWVVATLGAVLTILVPCIVLLGGFAARYRWLEGINRRFALRNVAIWGITIGVIGSAPAAADFLGFLPPNFLISASCMMLAQVSGVAGGIGYIALFGWLCSKPSSVSSSSPQPPAFTRAVAAIGKRSLSFYLLQSVILAPLLSAWGFGLGGVIGSATAYLIAGVVWVVSLLLALWLEHKRQRGPAELLLRRLTYGKYWSG